MKRVKNLLAALVLSCCPMAMAAPDPCREPDRPDIDIHWPRERIMCVMLAFFDWQNCWFDCGMKGWDPDCCYQCRLDFYQRVIDCEQVNDPTVMVTMRPADHTDLFGPQYAPVK